MISLSTYFSIDSVNALSSMEGNVLCNENYNAEYQILANEFSDCKDAIELEEKLYDTLYTKLKKNSKTCMQFTDRIQEILDHILWYAYTDSKTDVYKEHIREMIELVDTRYRWYAQHPWKIILGCSINSQCKPRLQSIRIIL